MSPSPSGLAPVRSAARVNEEIRALVLRASGRQWTHAERTLYGLLVEEWLHALQAEMVQAA